MYQTIGTPRIWHTAKNTSRVTAMAALEAPVAGVVVAVDNGCYANFVEDRAGYGLAQWIYPTRKAGLLAHARIQECSIGDLDMQVGYLLIDMNGPAEQIV